jgi:hypothetical protein
MISLFFPSAPARHEFKREVAPSPALHLLIHGNTNPGFKGLVCICLLPCICMELDMEMELLPFMRDAVVLTLCSVLSFVPSPQWHLASLCLVHGWKLTILCSHKHNFV